MALIYNINPQTFGPLGVRNGDLVAICNIVHDLRKKKNDPALQFYLEPGVLNAQDYIQKFFRILCSLTDCFSLYPGQQSLPWRNVGVWDYRDISGDHVTIVNPCVQEKKVVVFPVYDAEYNVQRNWSMAAFYNILKEVNAKYPDYERIVCAREQPPPSFDMHGFTVSTDFNTNIEHIMTAAVFVGGDTGVSHFASVLRPGPEELVYVYSSHCLLHTLPFYYLSERRGRLETYWLDFTGTVWE